MIVEAWEVRDRFAARVALLSGYGEADAPFDPSSMPANFADRPFSVAIPATDNGGMRDRSSGVMEAITRVVVRVQAPVTLAGPNRLTVATEEYKREAVLIRALMAQGDAWMHGLRIAFVGTTREYLVGDAWLETSHTFTVGHLVQL